MLAKYFCSLTWNRLLLTKFAPFLSAAALTSSSSLTFSPNGTSKAFFLIGVFQDTSPSPFCGANSMGDSCSFALALAMATASSAALAIPSGVTVSVAKNPQPPSAMTRTPAP